MVLSFGMSKILLTVSCLVACAALPGAASALEAHSMTRCVWLAQGGKNCSQSQLRAELFYLPQGPLVGCRAKPGIVTLNGGRTNKHPQVALTFDDGPSAYTQQYLKVLRQYRVHAAFFLIGNQISAYPHLLQQELQQGHLVGNHSWDHPMFTAAKTDVAAQLGSTQAAILRGSGFRTCLMRPPYGAWNKKTQLATAASGLQIVLWDVDSRDWSRPGTVNIVRNSLSGVRDGSIILMHDGGGERTQTLAALPLIIKGLRADGFKIVRLDKLLGTKLKHS